MRNETKPFCACTASIVPIENIKEIRTGINARYHRAQYGFSEEAENRWITLIYVLDGEYKTLHILADTKEVFTAWETAITKLHSIRQGLMKGLGQTETRQAVWERQYYKAADKNGDQKLDVSDVEELCKRLNINIKTEELRKLFVVCSGGARSKRNSFLISFLFFLFILRKQTRLGRATWTLKVSVGS